MREPRSLGEFPYRRVVLACPWCPRRRGSYDTERLIARLGPGASLDEVLLRLVVCRWPKPWGVRGPNAYVPWCRARFAELGAPDRPTGTCPGPEPPKPSPPMETVSAEGHNLHQQAPTW